MAKYNLKMFCPDCAVDGVMVLPVFDAKQMGDVCTRCERVYAPNSNPKNFHYATEKAFRRKIARDQKERANMSASTAAVAKRILDGRI